MLDGVVPRGRMRPRRWDLSALASANRVADPRSKLAFADWGESDGGGRWVGLHRAAPMTAGSGTPWTLGEAELLEIETRRHAGWSPSSAWI